MRLPAACLVVVVGPSGSGKSHWAAANFRPEVIVSSDALRAMVGADENDQRAGPDAFEMLDLVLERRLARRLFTVVDTLGLDPDRRARVPGSGPPPRGAVPHGRLRHARPRCAEAVTGGPSPIPAKVLTAQLAAHQQARAIIDQEGFDGVHPPETAEVVASALADDEAPPSQP